MEKTLENKGKFFALYWGQKVMKARITNSLSHHKFTALMNVDINADTLKENWFLELTPLSQITDEHAIEVAKADCSILSECQWDRFEVVRNFKEPITVFAFKAEKSIKFYITESLLTYKGVDKARSKAYYIGDGTEVSFGWVKLKEG